MSDEDREPTKVIEYWLVVDWKKEQANARKTRPEQSDLGKNELLTRVEFRVHVPENPDVPTLAADLDLPEPMVRSATLDALDERDLPDYANAADEILSEKSDAVQNTVPGELDGVVSSIVVATLERTNTRPRVEDVRDYVEEQVGYLRGDT